MLDWDENAYQLQPRNALHRLKKWDGDDDDRQLLHLATFLRSLFFFSSNFLLLLSLKTSLVIAASGVEDVRDVLDHYNQESDPVQAFLLRQQALIV
jgi:hypothetical protein